MDLSLSHTLHLFNIFRENDEKENRKPEIMGVLLRPTSVTRGAPRKSLSVAREAFPN